MTATPDHKQPRSERSERDGPARWRGPPKPTVRRVSRKYRCYDSRAIPMQESCSLSGSCCQCINTATRASSSLTFTSRISRPSPLLSFLPPLVGTFLPSLPLPATTMRSLLLTSTFVLGLASSCAAGEHYPLRLKVKGTDMLARRAGLLGHDYHVKRSIPHDGQYIDVNAQNNATEWWWVQVGAPAEEGGSPPSLHVTFYQGASSLDRAYEARQTHSYSD